MVECESCHRPLCRQCVADEESLARCVGHEVTDDPWVYLCRVCRRFAFDRQLADDKRAYTLAGG